MTIVPHSTQTYLLEPTPVNQSGQTITNLRKSSRSRQTPAHLQIYECDFPSSIDENTTARSIEQNQQVSHTQLRNFRELPNILPSSPTRPKEAICLSLVKIELLSSSENSEASLGPRKSSDDKFQNHGSSNFTLGSFQQPLPSQHNPNQHSPNPNIDSNTNIPISQSGKKRKSTAPLFNDIIRKPVDDLFCNVCQASCSSTFTLNQHLEGRRHKANLARSQEKRICREASTANTPRCNACQIWCMDMVSLEMHFKGKKHNAKLQELEVLQRYGLKNAKKTIRCELCLVYCMNEEAFDMHVTGKAHTARVELARRGV